MFVYFCIGFYLKGREVMYIFESEINFFNVVLRSFFMFFIYNFLFDFIFNFVFIEGFLLM